MKKIKSISILLVLALTTFFLGGCGAGDKLFKAIDNTSNLKSYAFKGKYKITGVQQKTGDAVQDSMENLDFDVNGRVVQEKNKSAKMDMNVKYNIMGIGLDMNMISAVDMKKQDYKIFIKIPEILKQQMGEAAKGIEYLYMGKDTMDKLQKENKDSKEQLPEADMKEMADSMTNLQEGVNQFVKNYAEENGKDIIKDSGKKEVEINGVKEKVDAYTIKIDDKGFKKFLKAFVNDKERKVQLENLLQSMLAKDEKGKVDYKKTLESIDKMPKIIGDKGATIEFAVKDKYVVQEKVNMDLIVDGNNVGYVLDMTMFDLNKDMSIKVPEKNNKVIDLVDLLNGMMTP